MSISIPWNVKRIKPAAFVPYDLARPAPTRLLWVFEGFTSYYDDLFLLRAGTITRADYLRLLGETITSVARTPGAPKQSVAESSFDALDPLLQAGREFTECHRQLLHKGALVALGLDLTVRRKSGGGTRWTM